jgi:hypothetical protein
MYKLVPVNGYAASGVHPKVAQVIMRHSNINLTMSQNTHIFRGQKSEAITKLPDLSFTKLKVSKKSDAPDGERKMGLPPEDGKSRTSENSYLAISMISCLSSS